MIISSAYIFAKQIKSGEVPGLDVVWFNSKNASPMQSFGNNSNPFIRRETTGSYWTSFVRRQSSNYSEPPADFIGLDATPMNMSDLPWELEITLVDSNGEDTEYRLRYKAEVTSSNTVTVSCEFGHMTDGVFSPVHSDSPGAITRDGTDQSLQWYLFTGAGAFLGNRAGSTTITNVSYIGVIAAGKTSGGTRFVDVSGSSCDLTKIAAYDAYLPQDRLSD